MTGNTTGNNDWGRSWILENNIPKVNDQLCFFTIVLHFCGGLITDISLFIISNGCVTYCSTHNDNNNQGWYYITDGVNKLGSIPKNLLVITINKQRNRFFSTE